MGARTSWSGYSSLIVFALPLLIAFQASANSDACRLPDQDVVLIETVQPPYPYLAHLFCIEGHAKFEFTIRADGTVADVEPIDSEPVGAFEGTGDVLRFWQFEPRCIDGKAVERNARQTIEFKLSSLPSGHCPDQLPEEVLDMRIELTALYQQIQGRIRDPNGNLKPLAVESMLDEPFASIERAHRRYLNERLEFERQWRVLSLRSITLALEPANLANGRHLEQLPPALEYLAEQRTELYWKWPDIQHALSRELIELGESTELDDTVRSMLIDPHAQALAEGFEPNHAMISLEQSLVSEYRALIDFLQNHRHEWEVKENALEFADQQLSRQYRQQRDAINAIHHAWDRKFFMPERVYWSGI
ncbi:MAG: energy transducer TonB [Xanthomonadaceae bacterium]|nr:energy transducer TonB [Xanthomonadaceae bacterium]